MSLKQIRASGVFDGTGNAFASNEIMFKDAISLTSDVEYIVLPDEQQKKQVLEAFRAQGVGMVVRWKMLLF